MKKILVIIAMLAILIGTTNNVSAGNSKTKKQASNNIQTKLWLETESGNITDGDQVHFSWRTSKNVNTEARVNIRVIGLVNGVESWGYDVLYSGWFEGEGVFIPRVLRVSGDQYIMRATWTLNGQVIAVEDTDVFQIILPGEPRSITIDTATRVVTAGEALLVSWETTNLPDYGFLLFYLQPSAEVGGQLVGGAMNSDGSLYCDTSGVAPGYYVLQCFYISEAGHFSAESNPIPIEVR